MKRLNVATMAVEPLEDVTEKLAVVTASSLALDDEALVPAEEVTSLSRLGDLLDRTINDYPREVQAPVRIAGHLDARYPPEARAQGVEGDVVAWVLVDPSANVEEIQIVEGDAIFHDAVIEAIRHGIFKPAFDAGQGLHYPIGLTFHFVLDAPRGAPARQLASAPPVVETLTP